MINNFLSLFVIAGILIGGTIPGQQLAFADNDELKVKIEIEDGIAEVEVEFEEDEYEFELATTNLDEILEITSIRTGISVDLLEAVMDLEVKDEFDDSDDIEDEIEDDTYDDGPEDIDSDSLEKKLRASTIGDSSQVKIELKFITDTTDFELLIDEIMGAFAVTQEEAENFLKIQEGDDDELEEGFSVEIETDNGFTEVEIELRYSLDSTDLDVIISSIVEQSQLDRELLADSIDVSVKTDDDSFDGVLDVPEGILDDNSDSEGLFDDSDSEMDTLRVENEELRDENQLLREEIEDLKEQIANLNHVLMEQIRVIMDTLATLRP